MAKKIKTTGVRLPKVDSKTISDALGPSEIIKGPHKTEDGRTYFEITFVDRSGTTTTKNVYELTGQDEILDHVLIGTAQGEDFFHCLSIATRNQRNSERFLEQVSGYYFLTARAPNCKMAVGFCKDKK